MAPVRGSTKTGPIIVNVPEAVAEEEVSRAPGVDAQVSSESTESTEDRSPIDGVASEVVSLDPTRCNDGGALPRGHAPHALRSRLSVLAFDEGTSEAPATDTAPTSAQQEAALATFVYPDSMVDVFGDRLSSKLARLRDIFGAMDLYSRCLHADGSPPTMEAMVDAMVQQVRSKEALASELRCEFGAENRIFERALAEAEREMKKACEGAVKATKAMEQERFDPENPAHQSAINLIAAKTRGEVGELDVLARIPDPVAKSFKLVDVDPSEAAITLAAADIRVDDDGRCAADAFFEVKRKAKIGAVLRENRGAKARDVVLTEEEREEAMAEFPSWRETMIARLAVEAAKRAEIERLRRVLLAEFQDHENPKAKTEAILCAEQDLLFNNGTDWGEVKNYASVITVEKLVERRTDAAGRQNKSILDQAIEHVRTFRAIHGVRGELHQFFVNGVTPQAARMLQRMATGLRVHGVVVDEKPARMVGHHAGKDDLQLAVHVSPPMTFTAPDGEPLRVVGPVKQTTTRHSRLMLDSNRPFVPLAVRAVTFNAQKMKHAFDGSRGSQFFHHVFSGWANDAPEGAFVVWALDALIRNLPGDTFFFDRDPSDDPETPQHLELTLEFDRPIGTTGVMTREELDRENIRRAGHGLGPLEVKVGEDPFITSARQRGWKVERDVEHDLPGYWVPDLEDPRRRGKFYPDVGFVESLGLATNKITMVFVMAEDGVPEILTIFPGENACPLPTKIDRDGVDTTRPGSIPRSTWANAENMYDPDTLISLRAPESVHVRFGHLSMRVPTPADVDRLRQKSFTPDRAHSYILGEPESLLRHPDLVWGTRLLNEVTATDGEASPSLVELLASRGVSASFLSDPQGKRSLEITLRKPGKELGRDGLLAIESHEIAGVHISRSGHTGVPIVIGENSPTDRVTLVFTHEVDPYSGREEVMLKDAWAGKYAPSGPPTPLVELMVAPYAVGGGTAGARAERRIAVWKRFRADQAEHRRLVAAGQYVPKPLQYIASWSEQELGEAIGRWERRTAVAEYLRRKSSGQGIVDDQRYLSYWSDTELERLVHGSGESGVAIERVWLPGFWDRYALACTRLDRNLEHVH